ncbi:Aftiphilin [Araneus ventricosus]|uniref:Aftiphilin n=1 Tax=Araneus ventricosus TaxID=182803 RepID=A0A4Y2EK25_ARAVE|nr:Aftiphilin [Araneus ventricosus]
MTYSMAKEVEYDIERLREEFISMASNFIPMLSSSPPPLDDCPDNDDDDDEFGTFTSANIPFDSSFDSPVAGEKYKPFKTGANGVNDITLNNDLNTFCSYSDSQPSPTPKYTLSFSPQTPKKCKNSSPIEGDDDVLPDQIEKCCSSSEDIPSKINSSASQKCVSDSVHTVNRDSENSYNSHEDSNLLERNELSTCSIEETLKIESESPDSSNSNCDADKIKKSLFVPPCDDEFDKTENSNEMHTAYDETFQSSDVVEECQESLPVVNTSKCVMQRSNDVQSKVEENISSSIPQNSISENLDSEFSADLPHSDEFDDFQTANHVSNSIEKCSDIERKYFDGEDKNPETFQADFADFQSSGDYHCKDSKFENFQSCEKHSHSEAEEFGDFDSFQIIEDGHQSDADEFDDFQSCDKTIGVSSSLNEDEHVGACSSHDDSKFPSAEEPIVPDDDFDEEFDDFQACSDISAPVEQGFANFETQPFDQKEESEFADFESASFNSASSETFQSSVHPSMNIPNQEKNMDKLSAVTSTIFPLKEEESNVAEASYDPASEILEQCNKSRRLWEKLHEVEQTPGLRFQWGVSHSFQQLLRSVNVDYHSILRTSSVPIFASSLSLLEPVKGQASSASQESDDKIQSPKDPIPPVEFDWNSSGLVNPLDSVQAASILMDLSFLSSSESVTSSSVGNNSFENELLKPSPIPACSESNNTNFILEELLSKNVCSIPNSKIAHRQPNLSEEAKNVLDQLPDLSFMRAKVLMFPISSKT